MKIRVAVISLLFVVTAMVAPALAQDGTFTLGARGAFAVPFGTAGDGWKLDELVTSGVPVQVDADFRVGGDWRLGGYFSYGPVTIADEAKDSLAHEGLKDIGGHRQQRLGVQVARDFRTSSKLSPWVGVSVGYEWTRYAGAKFVSSNRETEIGMSGFEGGVQVGAAYKLTSRFSVGPYAAFDLGRFRKNLSWVEDGDTTFTDVNEKGTHQWLRLGVKVAYTF
jgi:hypothetical protein